jgi:DNA-binding SARP family transcriptional activator
MRSGAGSRAGLDLRVLGPLEARRGSDEVALGGRKQRTVLAILLVDPTRLVSIDELIDGLWGDAPPERAVGTLQAYISNLRRALEPDRPSGAPATVLVSRPRGYGLDEVLEQFPSVRREDAVAVLEMAADRLGARPLSEPVARPAKTA